jgi:hypothetical protein
MLARAIPSVAHELPNMDQSVSSRPALRLVAGTDLESISSVRDPRFLNHMAPEIRYVYGRLYNWAREAKQVFTAMGLPTESHYHKFSALGIAPNPGFPAPMSAAAMNVDKAYSKQCLIDRMVMWREHFEYRDHNIHKGIPGIESLHHYKKILRRAHHRLYGSLLMIEGEPRLD